MENPNKIEIEGLKTIHKLCNFGAEHDMEGCSFTEIVERMFSKIKSMQTQVNTLDEMLLNQGDALAEAKAQAVPESNALLSDAMDAVQKLGSGDFVLVSKEPSTELVNHGHDVFLGHFNEGGQTCGRSLYFAYKAMIEAQEQSHD